MIIDLLRELNQSVGFYWFFVILSIPLIPPAVLIWNIACYDKKLYSRIQDSKDYVKLTPLLWIVFSLGSVLSFSVCLLFIVFGAPVLLVSYIAKINKSESVLKRIEDRLSRDK